MDWYYADNGDSKGPVAQELFDRMVSEGIISRDTLVWHEGMSDWRPYSQVHGVATEGGGGQSGTGAGMGDGSHRCCEVRPVLPGGRPGRLRGALGLRRLQIRVLPADSRGRGPARRDGVRRLLDPLRGEAD